MRTGTADLPLHGGRAPRWLFSRMTLLARAVSLVIIGDEGPGGLMRRLADPVWFQAFGCVLGFDWHSSGLTTTVCGALKEGLKDGFADTGIVIAGGKGRASRRTPLEIETACEATGWDAVPLIAASRLSAKVDSSALQDGFQIYHHTFFFTTGGQWAVVQQGMNEFSGMARRYHWLPPSRFDADPHAAVAGERAQQEVLNLVASEADGNRAVSAMLAREGPDRITTEIARMRELKMPRHHELRLRDIHPERLGRVLLTAYEAQPSDYVDLLAISGVGARALRALSLVAELTYGEPASIRDPISYAYAHGGKDGTPFPVDREAYDSTIESISRALHAARAGDLEKLHAFRRLASFATPSPSRA